MLTRRGEEDPTRIEPPMDNVEEDDERKINK